MRSDDCPSVGEWNRWPTFVLETQLIKVADRCPSCGRFLSHGTVAQNGLGDLVLRGWVCERCGEQRPHYEYVEDGADDETEL